MRILWDEHKRQTNLEKHGYDFADLSVEFFETSVVRPTRLGRYAAFGFHDGRLVAVVFAVLGR